MTVRDTGKKLFPYSVGFNVAMLVLTYFYSSEARLSEIRQRNLEAAYPLFLSSGKALSLEQKKELGGTFDTAPADDLHSLIEKNTCLLRTTSFLDDDSLHYSVGSCIFVSPRLVLTNMHVAGFQMEEHMGNFSYFSSRQVYTLSGFESKVLRRVAVSPRYDLALVELEEAHPDFQTMSISSVDFEQGDYSWATRYSETLEPVFHTGIFSHPIVWEEGFISALGNYVPPCLDANFVSQHGMSGSPVFQEGRLVGLMATGYGAGTSVSHHVKEFLEDVLKDDGNVK